MRKSKKTRDQLLRELHNAYEGGPVINWRPPPAGRADLFTACCASQAPRCAAAAAPIAVPGRVDPPIVNRRRDGGVSSSDCSQRNQDRPSSPPRSEDGG